MRRRLVALIASLFLLPFLIAVQHGRGPLEPDTNIFLDTSTSTSLVSVASSPNAHVTRTSSSSATGRVEERAAIISTANCTMATSGTPAEICVFTNVCLSYANSNLLWLHLFTDHGNFSHKIFHVATTAYSRWSSARLNGEVVWTNSSELSHWGGRMAFENVTAVLLSHFGAENFGHQLRDTWFSAYRLLRHARESERQGPKGRAVIVFGRGCETYHYAVDAGRGLAQKQRRNCNRFVDMFYTLGGFSEHRELSLSSSSCFQRLVVNSGNSRDGSLSSPEPKSWAIYRDSIVSALGIWSNFQPDRRVMRAVIVPRNDKGNIGFPIKPEYVLELSRTLFNSCTVDVVVVANISAMSMRQQVQLMISAHVIVVPGGGSGFIGVFAPKSGLVFVAMYPSEPLFWSATTTCKIVRLPHAPQSPYPVEIIISQIKNYYPPKNCSHKLIVY